MIQCIIGGVVVLVAGAIGLYALHEMKEEKHLGHDHSYDEEQVHEHDRDGVIISQSDFIELAENVQLQPFSHASAVVRWDDVLILADPVGDAAAYAEYGTPDIVFITHRHGDHLDIENLPSIVSENTVLLAPQDVINQLPPELNAMVQAMAPGKTQTIADLTFEAVAAYNLRPEAQKFHPQSRGDIGFVISDETTRVYVSGDTEGIPEMQALKDIDVAFMAMNLPYTMGVEDAAAAVLTFAPKTVYPYHYRTPEGFSDIALFKALVHEQNPDIDVQLIEWYPETE